MANYQTLKAAIQDVIRTNGNNEITGQLLQDSLLAMITSLGANYQYAGIAKMTPTQTDPGTPDQNVFYICSEAGTYTNFGSLVVNDGEVAILKYNGTWSKDTAYAVNVFLKDVQLIRSSGQAVYNTGWSCSVPIAIYPGKTYNVKLFNGSAAAACMCYNALGATLGEFVLQSGTGVFEGTISTNDILSAYPTAAYFRVGGRVQNGYYMRGVDIGEIGAVDKSSNAWVAGFLNVNAITNEGTTTYTLQQAVDAVPAAYRYAARGITFKGTDGAAHFAVFSATISGWQTISNWLDVTDQINNICGKFAAFSEANPINHSGAVGSNASYAHTIPIPIIPGRSYKVSIYYGPSAIAACYCYDKELNPVGEHIFAGQSGIFSATLSTDDLLTEFPSASFFILSGRVDSHPYIDGLSLLDCLSYVTTAILPRLNNLEKELDPEKSELMMKAAEYDAINSYRERQLRQEYQDKVASEGYVGKWYGVQFGEESDPDNVTAINSTGDASLHTSLPIQNKMRRCVTKDNIVQYYLNENNSELKVDGTNANLDGTDGIVMVEIPEFFYKIEEEQINGVRTIRIKISEDAFPDFNFSPKRYTSAYEATINRTTGKLASVCTTNFARQTSEQISVEQSGSYIQGTGLVLGTGKTARRNGHTANAANFRGGTNDSSLDQYEDPTQQNFSRNQLGLPVANINIQEIRNACAENQFGYLYDTQRILYMLIQVEYKTRHIQKATSQGGLGMGATVYPNANGGYAAYEAFFTPKGGISTIPCGVTNVLGNKSGEVYFLLENVPVESTTSGDVVTFTRFANLWVPCMSYRGVEHYYGHIYKVADQVECVTGPTTGYVDGHSGEYAWSLHDVKWWYERNPYLARYCNKAANLLGTWNFACHTMTVSSLLMGKFGHVLHIGTSQKDYLLNYCDCSELDSKEGQRKYITFNGRIVSWNLVGNHFIVAFNTIDGGDKRPSDGTRVEHF